MNIRILIELFRGALLGASVALPSLLFMGCRGDISRQPPIHLNPNMDNVQRFDPQEANPFFADGRAQRPLVEGTVARGELKADDRYWRGMDGILFVTQLPVPLEPSLVERGRARYNVYCSVCHDGAGTGEGIAVRRGMLRPPSYHEDRIRAMPVGQIFSTISNGVRNMPSYGAQIPVADRWAIVSYVRALQVSRHAGREQIPDDIANQKGWQP